MHYKKKNKKNPNRFSVLDCQQKKCQKKCTGLTLKPQ